MSCYRGLKELFTDGFEMQGAFWIMFNCSSIMNCGRYSDQEQLLCRTVLNNNQVQSCRIIHNNESSNYAKQFLVITKSNNYAKQFIVITESNHYAEQFIVMTKFSHYAKQFVIMSPVFMQNNSYNNWVQ